MLALVCGNASTLCSCGMKTRYSFGRQSSASGQGRLGAVCRDTCGSKEACPSPEQHCQPAVWHLAPTLFALDGSMRHDQAAFQQWTCAGVIPDGAGSLLSGGSPVGPCKAAAAGAAAAAGGGSALCERSYLCCLAGCVAWFRALSVLQTSAGRLHAEPVQGGPTTAQLLQQESVSDYVLSHSHSSRA